MEKDVTSYELRVTLSNSRKEHSAEHIALSCVLTRYDWRLTIYNWKECAAVLL